MDGIGWASTFAAGLAMADENCLFQELPSRGWVGVNNYVV